MSLEEKHYETTSTTPPVMPLILLEGDWTNTVWSRVGQSIGASSLFSGKNFLPLGTTIQYYFNAIAILHFQIVLSP